MTNQLTTLNPAQVPAAFHSLMQQMQNSELSQNVGANYAVVSIKGKVFRVKHAGTETAITIQFNGQEYAAPYMDVVIPLANAALSKTYYASGYTEGSDESPTCWSEDGRTPLAPLENRPIDPRTGQHVHDCATCPMNVFGSKVNEVTGAKGKACADTRKLVIVPVDANGHVDTENARYGGPMLLRVPAASLQPFAEYDRKLQAVGVPYFAVVTRLQFDQSVAYPKFQLSPVRIVTEAEAAAILELRNGPQVQAILSGGHTAAPALPPPAAQVAPVTAAIAQATGGHVPGLTIPASQTAPVAAPAPQVVPVPAAAPAPAAAYAPPPAPPAPTPAPAPSPAAYAPPAPPAPTPAPVPAPAPAPAFAVPPAPAAPTQPATPAPHTVAPMPPQIAYPAQGAPAAAAPAPAAPGLTVSPELLGRIDQLLDT